jgi:hypothetical protein
MLDTYGGWYVRTRDAFVVRVSMSNFGANLVSARQRPPLYKGYPRLRHVTDLISDDNVAHQSPFPSSDLNSRRSNLSRGLALLSPAWAA